MGHLTEEELRAALINNDAQRARCEVCSMIAAELVARGQALWGFGLFSDDPAREAIALVAQYGGELATGAVTLFERANWYGGAALVRQMIEIEYLAYLFASDLGEPEQWRSSSRDELRSIYQPAKMRKRSGGHFRDREYWMHCDIGGHPSANSLARTLLPEHDVYDPTHREMMRGMLWADLGQHLEELWNYLVAAAAMHGCGHVLDNSKIEGALVRWHERDLCASRVSVSHLHSLPGDVSE